MKFKNILLIKDIISYTLYYSGINYIYSLFNKKPVIIMYHRVLSEDSPIFKEKDKLIVSKENFEKQIKYLAKNYKVISLKELINNLKNKKIQDKTVVITFDDNYKDNYINAYPILKKYNVPATIFLAAGYVDTNKIYDFDEEIKNSKGYMLSWKEIKEMNKNKIDFGAHTVNHVILSKVNLDKAEEEIINSKKIIEKKLNQKIRLFAYPHGRARDFNQDIIKILKENDFDCSLSTIYGKINLKDDLYSLKRIGMSHENNFISFKVGLTGVLSFFVKILEKFYRD